MATKAQSGRRLSLRACRIGLPDDGEPGWLVLYAHQVLAVLSHVADGKVVLAAGFRPPFVDIDINWPDLATARADFSAVARLYRAGVAPGMIELAFSPAEG